VAFWSILVSAGLAASNLTGGWLAGSTSEVAIGLEFVGDVISSTVVLLGLLIGAKPADSNHPYGHGRLETLTGLGVGMILVAGGIGISYRSLQEVDRVHGAPGLIAVWLLLGTIVVRSIVSTIKFRVGRRIQSASLIGDAWNDAVDILSAASALVALGLTLYRPERFLAADHYGGFAVGVVVVFTGLRVLRDTSMELMDVMPDRRLLEEIRAVASNVPGVLGVEKCLARKSGVQYYVDLHLEVDPNLTVWESHELAGRVRSRLRQELHWIADVLIHVEPSPAIEQRRSS
jgi:cation diffusion facilitator family transporter